SCSRPYQLVYKNDHDGNQVHGSKTDLKNAVLRGAYIRVVTSGINGGPEQDFLVSGVNNVNIRGSEAPINIPLWPRLFNRRLEGSMAHTVQSSIYMKVESVGGELVSDLSPFRIHREIKGSLGGECKISKTKRGVMLELAKKSDEEKLTKMKVLGGIQVKVARDAYLNTSRGVINYKDLRGNEEEEFVECITPGGSKLRGGGEDQHEYIRLDLRLPHPTL
ncbi:hypothetical protein ElyMa_006792400, partial [Elysia marginata]